MKYLISILICLFTIHFLHAQYYESCIPKDLIIAGDGVNFRSEPNTNTKPIGKLDNGEFLIFKEVVQGNQNRNWIMLTDSWLKVQRVSTGDIGFVFGKYVRTQESIFPDNNRIQNGNWYGICQEGPNVVIEKSKPVIRINEDGDTSIIGNNERQRVLICSQSELKLGKIAGRMYRDDEGNLSIGKTEVLLRTGDYVFSLACTGEVELNDYMGFTRINERIIFVIEKIDGSQRHYSKQDLTDCILKFGEVGYHVVFAGDLNNDGIPEIIFSEADTREGVMYYFMSNKERKLELKSITYGADKC